VLSSASADPHYNLALALSKNGQPERAQAELAIAHELGRNSIGAFRDAVALDSLSLAYGQQGKITEAGQCARQALELAIEAKSTALIDNIKRRLIDYEGAMKLD
jgi:tetratricopeptide (TPR) repeat protein